MIQAFKSCDDAVEIRPLIRIMIPAILDQALELVHKLCLVRIVCEPAPARIGFPWDGRPFFLFGYLERKL